MVSLLWKVLLENILVIFERIFRCCCVMLLGMSRNISSFIGWLLGDLKGIGVVRCMNSVSGVFRFLMWLCGMVMLCFSLVEFRCFCVNRFLEMVECVMLLLFLKVRLVCLKVFFLLDIFRFRIMFFGDRIFVRLVMMFKELLWIEVLSRIIGFFVDVGRF